MRSAVNDSLLWHVSVKTSLKEHLNVFPFSFPGDRIYCSIYRIIKLLQID